jgi:Type VI secretion system/phage-baseplate injector OB domain
VKRFYGKYEGKVEKNFDPEGMGRVQVSVPTVLGDTTDNWAMPCSPFAGPGMGLFTVPPVGAKVWVEFRGGDIKSPILAGCYWGKGEAPAPLANSPTAPQTKVFKTDGITITIDDAPGAGGLTIEVSPPVVATALKLVFDSSGIALSNSAASVKLTTASVSLNDGALEVI